MNHHFKKNILIAGGAGFLGANLCKTLLEKGHSIVCVDNLSTCRQDNLNYLRKYPAFKFIEQDICNPIELENIDLIYNLACPASPPRYQADPIQTLKTCFLGSLQSPIHK